MTFVEKKPFWTYEYTVGEWNEGDELIDLHYCSLEEVLYILSQKEGAINVQELVSSR